MESSSKVSVHLNRKQLPGFCIPIREKAPWFRYTFPGSSSKVFVHFTESLSKILYTFPGSSSKVSVHQSESSCSFNVSVHLNGKKHQCFCTPLREVAPRFLYTLQKAAPMYTFTGRSAKVFSVHLYGKQLRSFCTHLHEAAPRFLYTFPGSSSDVFWTPLQKAAPRFFFTYTESSSEIFVHFYRK